MYLASAATGIRFNDCFFSEPVRLADWIPPRFTGVFVILACDPNWAPRPFQPVSFGELGNNTPQPARPANGAVHGLYVSVLLLPFSTSAQRTSLRNELIAAYNPMLQGRAAAASHLDLNQRIDELEKRYQEHSAQMLMMLSNIHRHFEPLAVPVRRRIGFQPESA